MTALLDTSVVVWLLRGDPDVRRILTSYDELYINAVVLGEILYGNAKAARPVDPAELQGWLLSEMQFLLIGVLTATRFGAIEHALRLRGVPRPSNDVWIAATAMEYDLTPVTSDRHFERIDGLKRVVL
jgi:predicted nucleic acid-binding protein